MMKHSFFLVLVGATALAMATACSDSESTNNGTTSSTTSTTSGTGGAGGSGSNAGGGGTTGTTTGTGGNGTGGMGAGGSGATTGTGGTGGMGTGGMGTGGTGGGMGVKLVNNCNPATAEPHLNDANTTVKFGGNTGSKYAPACIRIKAGSTVTFSGDGTPMMPVTFAQHPLHAGEVVNGSPQPDPNSPIPSTSGPQINVEVTFPNAGTFPYYCENHYKFYGMMGAVFVDP